MIDLHVLQLCLTTYFITMLGFTSDPQTTRAGRTAIKVSNIALIGFVIGAILTSKG